MRAVVDARSITRARSPGKWKVAVAVPSGVAKAMQTVPTGFSGVPPEGPAMPDVATAQSAPSALRAPSAICRATGSETAP